MSPDRAESALLLLVLHLIANYFHVVSNTFGEGGGGNLYHCSIKIATSVFFMRCWLGTSREIQF